MTLRAEYAIAAAIAVALSLVTALTLCSGCRTSALPTPMALAKVESKHGLNTRQSCSWDSEAAEATDRALTCLVDAMATAGRLDRAKSLADLRRDPPIVCVVPQPEACGWGPCADNVRCQRRSGCTYWGSSVWVARYWPPRCDPQWPQERACVEEGPQREVWRETLTHEMAEVLHDRHRLGSAHDGWSTAIQRGCTDGPHADR